MNSHKLRILPLFLLMIGLTTLTAGCKKKDMSLKLNTPHNIRGVVSYKRSFPDLNDTHLEVAKKIGIRPLADREAAEAMKEKLTHITDNEFYAVDSLTHSIPYLVPRASALLDTIGSNFLDSLTAKGLNPNQVIVTSVLRTQNDIKRLRRRNGNASENSAHCFGATFDVSWRRFKKIEDKDGRPLQDVGADTLKLVLSEVLRDLRKAEKCYIKYELKQGCFHITAR
ncbi:DUF5715 family protein [Bacteroides ovatus]|uniref:Uncharacterized protein n=1 Tax=Bacteroides ovatus TaxID=28116 RepID=A0A1G8CNR7_BACOV|nr:DUF5715 family protein [Bacteroides ovatus]SDH46982.1 hypothetical protein SAMN05192582_100671 [Bacteroides ovatus]